MIRKCSLLFLFALQRINSFKIWPMIYSSESTIFAPRYYSVTAENRGWHATIRNAVLAPHMEVSDIEVPYSSCGAALSFTFSFSWDPRLRVILRMDMHGQPGMRGGISFLQWRKYSTRFYVYSLLRCFAARGTLTSLCGS